MVSQAEYWKVEEHEPVHPHLRVEMSPAPTRFNRRNDDDGSGHIGRSHPNAELHVAVLQGAMERMQPGHRVGIDLRQARTKTAAGSLTDTF